MCFSVCYWQVGSFLGTNTSVFFALADQIGVKVQSLFLNLKQVEILGGRSGDGLLLNLWIRSSEKKKKKSENFFTEMNLRIGDRVGEK